MALPPKKLINSIQCAHSGCMSENPIRVLTDNSDLARKSHLHLYLGLHALRVPAVVGFLILAVTAFGACSAGKDSEPQTESTAWSDSVLTSLSLEEKVGQLLMVDLPLSASISNPDERNAMREDLERLGPGGVIIFAADPVQAALHLSWAQYSSPLPLLVGLDAEWGAGYRLRGLNRLPDAMAIGASGNHDFARVSGEITAKQAASVGVNVIFAPTVDVNINPANPVIGTRSWSDHPDSVVAFAGSFIQGVESEGLLPVMKHFPGHGGTSRDSHTDLPIAEASQEEFEQIHVHPFKKLIADTDAAVMSAHIIPEGHLFTDSKAATFSSRILNDLLRDSLEYGGLVFTDALNMAGAASAGSPVERSLAALEAGADVLLMPPNPNEVKAGIIKAVRSGELSEARIDSSVIRVLRAKETLGLHQEAGALDTDALFGSIDNQDVQQELRFLSRDAVTVLKDGALLPVAPSTSMALVSIDFRSRNRGPEGPAHRFKQILEDHRGAPVNLIEVAPRTWTGQMPTILRNTQEHDIVVIADYTGNTPVFGWNQVDFVRDVSAGPARIVYVSFGKPYALPDLADFPSVILQSYDASEAMAEATADVLFGLADAKGRLPVHISRDWPRGSGLNLPARFAAPDVASAAGLDAATLSSLSGLLEQAIADSAFPTAALAIGRDLTVAHQGLHGYHTFESDRALNDQDVFDLASLTKVISTTTAIMLLVEDGLVDLDRPVADYLPAFGQNGKGMVTVRDLLSHTGGLIPFVPFHMQGVRSGAEVRRRILSDTLAYEPGSRSRYSDFGPITLAWMTEEITGEPFDRFVTRRVFEPLAMVKTGYHSSRTRNRGDAVPTETDDYFRNRTLQGEVHDETAWLLGGTAGHAGLFSTLRDLTRFAGMLSREGRIGETPFLKPETIRRFTKRVDPEGRHTRALGWDTKSMTGYSSAGGRFGPRSFGHTGFTGTSFWYDPDAHLYVILLTNRVHPTRDNRKHIPIRPAVANAAFEALDMGLNPAEQPAE